ncbi:MAG: surface lipoprotein assembly modifier [Gallionellaceae bacterium]
MSLSTYSLAESISNLDEARRLLSEGKSAQSAALLKQDFAIMAGNAEYDQLLGAALYQSGQSGEALFAFERVLMGNPDNADVRLKAAQISVERGNLEYAIELLQPLAGLQLNNVQQQTQMKIRTDIDKASGRRAFNMRGYVLSGIGSDDNVTSGPNLAELILPKDKVPPPGISTVTRLGTAKAEQDKVGTIEAGISMSQAVGESTWLTADGNIHQGYNKTRADVNDGYGNLNLGVLTRNNRDFFGGAVLGQTYQVARVTYRNSLGGRLNWTHAFDDKLSVTSYLQQLTFVFPDHSIDNTTRRIIGATLQGMVGDDLGLQCGLYGGNEVAQDPTKPQFSFHLTGASLGGRWSFSKDVSLSVAANYESRTHDARDPNYLKIRVDSLLSAGTALDYKFSQSWHLIPSYSYTRNTSNAELYDFARHAYLLQLKWDFDNEKN